MARRDGHRVSPSTMSNVLRGAGTPTNRTLIAYLVAVGADRRTAETILARPELQPVYEVGRKGGQNNRAPGFRNRDQSL